MADHMGQVSNALHLYSYVTNICFFVVLTGIYIMQNTMVKGGGWSAGEKNKNQELGKKIKNGKEKGGKL